MRLWRNDQELTLSIQLVPYGDSEKLLLSRDITRWERMETTRRDFVANVSHELRTPLTVLGGFLETLSDMQKPDPDMLRRSLQLMGEQATRMQRLVEDLLTLSKLESAQNPLNEEFVDVPELVRSLFSDAQALSGGRHRFRLRVEDSDGRARQCGGTAQRTVEPHQQRRALHARGRRDRGELVEAGG